MQQFIDIFKSWDQVHQGLVLLIAVMFAVMVALILVRYFVILCRGWPKPKQEPEEATIFEVEPLELIRSNLDRLDEGEILVLAQEVLERVPDAKFEALVSGLETDTIMSFRDASSALVRRFLEWQRREAQAIAERDQQG